MLTFGIPGIVIMVIGIYMSFWALSEYAKYRVFPYSLTAVSGVFLLLGLMLINTALILNSIVQLIQKVQK